MGAEDASLVLADLLAHARNGGIQLARGRSTGLLEAMHFAGQVGGLDVGRFASRQRRIDAESASDGDAGRNGYAFSHDGPPIPPLRSTDVGCSSAEFVVTHLVAGRKPPV